MSRMSVFSSPLLLGFDQLEQLLDQATKAGDGYPPYNIERMLAPPMMAAKTGRSRWPLPDLRLDDLEVTVEGKQLLVEAANHEEGNGIICTVASPGAHLPRSFVLADGMEVTGAELENGLLTILLKRSGPRTSGEAYRDQGALRWKRSQLC